MTQPELNKEQRPATKKNTKTLNRTYTLNNPDLLFGGWGKTKITMAKLNFGGVEENVVTRDEFPLAKAQEVLKDEVVAVIGYGVQGPGQALNQKENGVNVIVGQRKNSKSWDKAVSDGFVPGETLFEIEELQKST